MISAAARTTVSTAGVAEGTDLEGTACGELSAVDTVDVAAPDEADPGRADVESAARETPGFGFIGGKSSCEIAITTSERNRARKKRLSIQGTGS